MTARLRQIFKDYGTHLRSRKYSIPCPLCDEIVFPKEFESHCTQHHHIDSKLSCVWCLGAVSWPYRGKTQHADHLVRCSRRFLADRLPPTPVTIPANAFAAMTEDSFDAMPTDVFDATPFCAAKDLLGRVHDPQPRAYDPVSTLTLPQTRLTYEIESLNVAAACVRAFQDRASPEYWCHLIVRGVAYQSFLEALDADEGSTHTLPFFCWCDGGELQDARCRRHRHMIVVSLSKAHFAKHISGQIRLTKEDRVDLRFRAFHTKPINTALHLVNTLGYVSQPKSSCRFLGGSKNDPKRFNHYAVHWSLPRDYRLVLALEWPGGLDDLLHQDFKNMACNRLVRAEVAFVDGKWHMPVRAIPGIAWGKKIPLHPNWRPCDAPTPHFLYLLNGKTQCFEFGDSSATFALCLYDEVRDEPWPPKKFHQELLHAFRPLVDRNAELESENKTLTAEIKTLTANQDRLHEKIHRLHEDDLRRLQTELQQAHAELAQLRDERDRLRSQNTPTSDSPQRVPRTTERDLAPRDLSRSQGMTSSSHHVTGDHVTGRELLPSTFLERR